MAFFKPFPGEGACGYHALLCVLPHLLGPHPLGPQSSFVLCSVRKKDPQEPLDPLALYSGRTEVGLPQGPMGKVCAISGHAVLRDGHSEAFGQH